MTDRANQPEPITGEGPNGSYSITMPTPTAATAIASLEIMGVKFLSVHSVPAKDGQTVGTDLLQAACQAAVGVKDEPDHIADVSKKVGG